MFPQLEDYSDAYLAGLGYERFNVSVFDHWLTEEEASKSPIIMYKSAKAADCLESYLDGERKFIRLYRFLSEGGAYDISKTGDLTLPIGAPEVEDLYVASSRHQDMMDIYFPGQKIRAVGGYDRTDLLLVKAEDGPVDIDGFARSHGLWVI